MYRDNTLMPGEAVRLLALGLLATGERHYGELAADLRHFIGHLVGPSLDLVAQPLELLKVEGLMEILPGGESESAPLRITAAGEAELRRLLGSNLRSQVNDLNKLVIALKMRFLHLLPVEERRLQVELLVEIFSRELARLEELRTRHDREPGTFAGWLELELAQTRARLAWFEALAERL